MGVVADMYKRMQEALLPPGKLWRLIGASLLDKLFAGASDELERLDGRITDLLREAVPANCSELLPEHEAELDLTPTGTTAERKARVVALTLADGGVRPVDFQNALAPLLGQLPADVDIIEITHAQAVAMGDDREHYHFYVYRDPAAPGTYYLASAQALLDQMCRSSCNGQVIESINFLCDDPFSLCDRDILGA